MKTISVLGSTGSIGTQTLDVAEKLGLRVEALAAGKNITTLEAQLHLSCRHGNPRRRRRIRRL